LAVAIEETGNTTVTAAPEWSTGGEVGAGLRWLGPASAFASRAAPGDELRQVRLRSDQKREKAALRRPFMLNSNA
jgi:hypothetical protein